MGEIYCRTLNVMGMEGAFHGMRAPMQSYNKNDSYYSVCNGCYKSCLDYYNCINYIIGENDMKLTKKLINGGSEHSKFRRMIHVQVEIAMPRYWWSEFDTYKIGTVANSESTMHKLLNNNNPITMDQFYTGKNQKISDYTHILIDQTVKNLEYLRSIYKSDNTNSKDHTKTELLTIAKRILPESFIQVRIVDLNYENLSNIYKQRVKTPHRLKEEWVDTFGQWVKTLPYANMLIIC